ncbi:M56 family metallopeptidase [Bradyrhizobium ontarionense]|uniref:M56 family metallopeptidase n=1 Tax=Bradyrhizobium ontarionense TaxID=2898149 RepID=A0ABY3RCS9_9BRAD|nr:M56 family metallopeptidase [Bradyrhizobium sp. A19]UFZ05210.1 M56 family metallopeptidase [Bradyrhizobium sp. A19]
MLAVLAEAALRTVLLGSAVALGLRLCRVRHPQLQMTAWLVVLLASLAMPLAMHWTTVTVTVRSAAAPSGPPTWLPDDAALSAATLAPVPDDAANAPVAPVAAETTVSPWTVATLVYLTVAGFMLLRLVIGLVLTWRLVRRAEPLPGPAKLRLSEAIASPVTIGSTILVPAQWRSWDVKKQAAVLAHEASHIANRDFHVLVLAAVNRALFWFSPFAWWHHRRLAELAEMISDSSAIEALDDRVSYAEILLDIVQAPRGSTVALEMARPSTVLVRIERILSEASLLPRIAPSRRVALAALLVPLAVLSGLAITTRTQMASAKAVPGASDLGSPAQRAERVTFYALGSHGVFAVSRHGDALYGQLTGQRRLRLASAAPGHYAYADNAGLLSFVMDERPPNDLVLHQLDRDLQAARITEFAPCDGQFETSNGDDYAGWYELNANRVLTVSAASGGLQLSETGRGSFAVTADCTDSFSSKNEDLLLFLRDGKGRVTRLLVQDPLLGARVARRIDEPRAKAIEETFARRIAEVPDRFREQVPTPGSRDMVLRGIADLRRGEPNYALMSPSLAANIRQHATWLQTTFKTLGEVETIFFRGVGSGGYDIYGVKFANGAAEFRLLMTPDGKADDVIFRPDGNQAPGEVLDCASEANLRARPDATPIRLTVYNASRQEVQLYRLDDRGKRIAHAAIGDDLSSSFTTEIGSPWVVADASGRCLEIVMPGRRTRFHTVEAAGAGTAADHFGERRSAPLPDSEAKLRNYIETIVRGEPDYAHMTAEVAAYTRQQLAMNRAILARLGEIRAVSFRGVTALDSDIYMVHFANGTAEWRIGLARNGGIGRIALGPSF